MIAQEVCRRLELELGIHPRQDQRRSDWFGDVVDSPQFQAMDLVFGVGHGRQKDDGNVTGTRVALEMLRHFMAGQPGHHHVQQDQVRECVAL
ncbi:hypothetical protein D9M73_216650 [compost metagenome]